MNPFKGLVTNFADDADQVDHGIAALQGPAEIVRTQHRAPHPIHADIRSLQPLRAASAGHASDRMPLTDHRLANGTSNKLRERAARLGPTMAPSKPPASTSDTARSRAAGSASSAAAKRYNCPLAL